MKLTWKERLFSVKHASATHDQICFLGVRIKKRRPLQDAGLYHHLPVNPRKIVFHTVHGAYHCSPKAICEELLRRRVDCELVWLTENNVLHQQQYFPPRVRLVMRRTDEALRELATARIWIENERKLSETQLGLRKRPGQVYINTWHGSLGIKLTGLQRHEASRRARLLCDADDEQMDYLISNAAYTTAFYRDSFKVCGRILEVGCPRNDIFFAPPESQRPIIQRVRTALNLPADSRFLLYAPTFRESGSCDFAAPDYDRLASAFSSRFGGNWLPVVRLHYKLADRHGSLLPAGVCNASDYPDMQELLLAADAVITDYSSCIYDYLLTRRPGFIYAPDMSSFDARRGLCYPLSETPFPLAETDEQLEQAICSFDEDSYRGRVEDFLRGKGSIDDGHASERVADLIESILDGKELRA